MLNYKGLKGTYERLIISEASVDRQVDALLEQHMKVIPVTTRASEPGDELILDYAGYCDGGPFEGGTAQDQSLVLGSGTFIPREVAGFDSFAEMRKAFNEGMQAYADQQADADLKNRLLDTLVADYNGTIDEAHVGAALEAEMQSLRAQLARQGLTLEAYCRFTDKTEVQLREDRLPDARKRVVRQQVLLEIIDAEGIEASEAEVAEELQRLCRQNNMTPEQLSAHLDESAQRAIVKNVLADKALACLRTYGEIASVDKPEEY